MTARIATIALVIIAVLSQSGFAISIARAGVALDEAGKFTLFTDFRLRDTVRKWRSVRLRPSGAEL